MSNLTMMIPIIISSWLISGHLIPSATQPIATPQTNCPLAPSVDVEFFSVDQHNSPEVLALGTDPSGGILAATLNSERGLYRIDTVRDEMLPLIQDDDFARDFFAWSPDGRYIASLVTSSGQVGIWDAKSGDLYRVFDEQTPEPTRHPDIPLNEAGGAPRWFYFDVAWSPDSHFLAAVGTEPLRVWDNERQQLVFAPAIEATWWIGTLNYRQRFSDFLAWSPDGTYLALAEGNVVHLWETSTWQEVHVLMTSLDAIHTLTWSGSGFLVAGGAGGTRLVVWETPSWERVQVFDSVFQGLPELPTIYSVAWSPDNCWLAVGTSGTRIFILNPMDGIVARTLEAGEILQVLTVYQATSMSVSKLVWSLDSTQLFAVVDGIISE